MNNASREAIMNALWAVISANQTFQGSIDDTNIITGIPVIQMQSLYFGMGLECAGLLPSGVSIAGFPSTTSVKLSAPGLGPGGGVAASITGITFKKLYVRRFVLWSDVPQDSRPSLCWLEGNEDHQRDQNNWQSPTLVNFTTTAFIYTNSKISTPTSGPPPMSLLNPIVDGITQSLQPSPLTMRQTLGTDSNGFELVYHTWIDGKVAKNGGDLDGDGIAMIPIKCSVPS